MPDTLSIATLVVICTTVVCVVGVITLWIKMSDNKVQLSDRITKVESVAQNALQTAVEAESKTDAVLRRIEIIAVDLNDKIDRMGRAAGENNAAIREHVNQMGYFVRDKFPLKEDVNDRLDELKKSQRDIEEKIDDIRDRLPRKTD